MHGGSWPTPRHWANAIRVTTTRSRPAARPRIRCSRSATSGRWRWRFEPRPWTSSSPTIALSGLPTSTTLSKFLAGFKLSVTPSEPATVEVTLQGTTTKATIAAYELTLFSRALVLAAGRRTLTVKPDARLVGKPKKSVKVRLRIVAVDAAGNRRTSDTTITVKPDPKPKKKRKR